MELYSCTTSSFEWTNFVASAGAVLIGILAIVFSYFQLLKTLRSKKIEDERNEIYKKMNEFYGPLIQLRKKSYLLYQLFANKNKTADNEFKTLSFLLDNNTFDTNDKILLEQIISIGDRCSKLIESKAGLIDDETLRTEIIPKANTHYMIIRLAYEGAIKGEKEKFERFTFPSEIDDLLENRYKNLQQRLNELND